VIIITPIHTFNLTAQVPILAKTNQIAIMSAIQAIQAPTRALRYETVLNLAVLDRPGDCTVIHELHEAWIDANWANFRAAIIALAMDQHPPNALIYCSASSLTT
jgi:hypothetical protein